MKKIIYAVIIFAGSSLTFISCTEEEVKPQLKVETGGGTGSTGPIVRS